MNVLILIPHLYRGGTERTASRLTKVLNDIYNVHIVTFYDPSQFPDTYPYEGEHFCLNESLTQNIFSKFVSIRKRKKIINDYKLVNKIDVTISFQRSADQVNIQTATKNETIICCIRTILSKNPYFKNIPLSIYRSLFFRMYKNTTYILSQNSRIKEDLMLNFKLPEDKIKVIPNFYDFNEITKLYDQGISKPQSLTNTLILTNIGSNSYAKGQWHLIRILGELKIKSSKLFKLVLVGDGDYNQKLKDLAIKCGLSFIESDDIKKLEACNVLFTGNQKNPFKYLKTSDIFVFSSIFEGFPNAICESMVCGLPIISADCTTGPKELLDPENINSSYPNYAPYGILLPPFSGKVNFNLGNLDSQEISWVNTLINISKNRELLNNYRNQSRLRIQEFSASKILSKWQTIIEQ